MATGANIRQGNEKAKYLANMLRFTDGAIQRCPFLGAGNRKHKADKPLCRFGIGKLDNKIFLFDIFHAKHKR